MPSDVTVVVADSARLPAIREGAQLPGRVMHFTSGSLASAIETIRTYQPKLIAFDAAFAQTSSGAAFIGRVEALSIFGSAIRLLVEQGGRWVTTPRDAAIPGPTQPAAAAPRPAVAIVQPSIVPPSPRAVTPTAPSSTRRAPRFLVRDALNASVESGNANLIDISVLGAQLVSLPLLRPKQKIKIGLPDADDVLQVTANVAWSMFEVSPSQPEPYYRVGIEFTNAARQALEEYRRRYCGEQPIPCRGA